MYNCVFIILANLLALGYETLELSFTAIIYLLLAEPPKVNQSLASTGFFQVYMNPLYSLNLWKISIAYERCVS